MASSSPQTNKSPAPLSADLEALTSVYSEAAAYLAKLTAQLEELETTQTTLLHSYHATSTALADIRGYNAVAPTMELLPVYTAKVTRLKQLMIQQRQTVDRMKAKAEEVRKVKAANYERLRKRWEEEKERDKGLAARMVGVVDARMVGVVDARKSVGETSTVKKQETAAKVGPEMESRRVAEPSSSLSTTESRIERQVENHEVSQGVVEMPFDTPESSIPPTAAVVTKTVVRRKKKARQAEIE